MNDINENRLVAKVLKELSKIIEDCDVEGDVTDGGEYVYDLEMTFVQLAEDIRKRDKALDKSWMV